MAATFNWAEANGTATGSPATGTTLSGFGNSTYPTDTSWKANDDAKTASGGTAATASPIVAGNNSSSKYQFGVFSGTFTEILNCYWGHQTGVFGTGVTLAGIVTSTY